LKKVALVYVLAVFVPSLVLAWLAVRSLRDQQFLLERQRTLLYQGVADNLAKQAQDSLADIQHSFTLKVDTLLKDHQGLELSQTFDDAVRKEWPLVQVGFVVTLGGQITCPSPYSRPDAKTFTEDNGRFLGNRESAEVFWNPKQNANSAFGGNEQPSSSFGNRNDINNGYSYSKALTRNVVPQQQAIANASQGLNAPAESQQQVSKLTSSAAEFRQLIGEDREGTLARFVDNKLNVLLWYRPPTEPQLIFGAQLSIPQLIAQIRPLLQQMDSAFSQDICVMLLDDNAKPVAASTEPSLHLDFHPNLKRPFVATEIGEALPHWEMAAYLLNPAALTETARTLKLTLGLFIAVLVLAIGIGSWLIVADLNRQLLLARQKTDFVSNVSHELKTPLTSIRMFAELLAEGRVTDREKQKSYLGIITAETARLSRLINNVLDFARLERGEKKYRFQSCDLCEIVRETAETYKPHFETNGFKFDWNVPNDPIMVSSDRDALAQVLVNLLSNAEKYSDSRKEVTLEVTRHSSPLPYAEIKVLDRGVGVPQGSEEKIFEKFYRAHDALSSGIQGSGLGLTFARQIARAHGGEITHECREGGGSCFTLRLPTNPT
jgi:signal transduction histidine kinase